MSDPLAPWALGISLISLGVSAAVAYRSEFRGAAIEVRFLGPPDQWDDFCIVPVPGTANHTMLGVNQPFPDAPVDIEFRGDCHASIDNDGPKSGALWGLSVEFDGVPALWRASGSPRLDLPMTVEGKSGLAFRQPISFTCDQVRPEDAYHDLVRDSKPVTVRITYRRRGVFSSSSAHRTELKMNKATLQAAFRAWAAMHGLELRGPG